MSEEGKRKDASELPKPTEPTYSPDGVDLSVIRWMLSLTPDERMEVAQGFADAVTEIREQNRET